MRGLSEDRACVATLGRVSCLRCAVCPIWVFEDREEKHLSAVPKSLLLESVTGFVLRVQLSRLLSSDMLVCREKLRIG